jgi:hypothetical protein
MLRLGIKYVCTLFCLNNLVRGVGFEPKIYQQNTFQTIFQMCNQSDKLR